jgi:hypothetical protein
MKQIKLAHSTRRDKRAPVDKLASAELRARAETLDPAPIDVLVEVELPRLRIQRPPTWSNLAQRVRMGKAAKREKSPDAAKNIESVKAMLEDLSSTKPVWLSAAGAFVVALTGKQLLAAAASPYTRKIWTNRLLKRRSGTAAV